MNNYLLRHATENIWCNPGQDRQFVYRLARLTPRYGVRNTYKIFYETLVLPTQNEYYHVYQIGQALPKRLGLPNEKRRWLSLAEVANDHLLMSDVYLNSGVQFPRFQTFVWITPARNVIVAVKLNPRIADFEDLDVYWRVYSNAFFQSNRSEGRRYLIVKGMKVTTENELIRFQRELADIRDANPGTYPQYFVNGRYCQNISPVTATVDDVVEFVLDGSIKQVIDFPINQLPVFDSTLDSARKYLLHYAQSNGNVIDYFDDIDAYMYKPGIAGRFMGVMYHRNNATWLRMVTHKDYSVPVERLRSLQQIHPTDPRNTQDPARWPSDQWTTIDELTLRLVIRDSGYHRPLVPNSNRIQHLYRLTDQQIVDAMTGNSTASIPLWHAANLEQSPYIQMMSADPTFVYPIGFGFPTDTVDEQTAEDFVGAAYGYHAAAVILADTPTTVYNDYGYRFSKLKPEYWENSTVFEYDAQGVLLEWHRHVSGQHYVVKNPNAVRVESLMGRGDNKLNTVYGTETVTIPTGYNFRVYLKEVWGGQPIGTWRDITEAEDRSTYGFWDYTVTPTRWVWDLDPKTHIGAVRLDDAFLCYELPLTKASGQLKFSITSVETLGETTEETILELPFGQLDIFLNGRLLIENVDYMVQWPQVVLSNLEYLNDDVEQTLTIRGYGFCQNDLTRLPISETGWVAYGQLSNNATYDIFTNKVLQIVVDGHLKARDQVVFEESREGLTIPGERNGAPYQIKTPPIVFHEVFQKDREAREIDDAKDRQVSDYMTRLFPTPIPENPDGIPREYHVISPFANKLLHDLKEGWFVPEGIDRHYSDDDVKRWCADYVWLLDYDLANQDFDDVHIEIYPHWYKEAVALDLYTYTFYTRALKVFLRHSLNLSRFLTIA